MQRAFAISTEHCRKVLQLAGPYSEIEVKAAYYRLAKQYHPDCTPLTNKAVAVQKFRELTQARDTLLNNPQLSDGMKHKFKSSDYQQKWKKREAFRTEFNARKQKSETDEDKWKKRKELGLVLLGAGSYAVVYGYAVLKSQTVRRA